MKPTKRYSGDFMWIDCDVCFRNFSVVIKDGEQNEYFCPYCGKILKELVGE